MANINFLWARGERGKEYKGGWKVMKSYKKLMKSSRFVSILGNLNKNCWRKNTESNSDIEC